MGGGDGQVAAPAFGPCQVAQDEGKVAFLAPLQHPLALPFEDSH